jgi:hypothetical protein
MIDDDKKLHVQKLKLNDEYYKKKLRLDAKKAAAKNADLRAKEAKKGASLGKTPMGTQRHPNILIKESDLAELDDHSSNFDRDQTPKSSPLLN